MTRRVDHKHLIAAKEIVAAPAPAPRACTDHNFEIPTGIYAAMAMLFAGAVAVLAFAFRGNMLVSYGVVFAFLLAFFGIPALFVKTSGGNGTKPLSWARFVQRGIHTATGHTPAVEAAVLALLLPTFIFLWAVAIATIAAFIR